VIVDPDKRSVSWAAFDQGGYRPIERSAVIELGPAELTHKLDWA
jgi:hypothetical protein